MQARFLLAKLNPSSTYASAEGSMGMGGGSEVIMTDDVSLQVSSKVDKVVLCMFQCNEHAFSMVVEQHFES